MSNIEEPPSKITKYEMESQYLEGEVMEEGQEEWLSEGILTDENYTASPDQDASQETLASLEQSTDNIIITTNNQEFSQTFTEPQEYHITLNNTDYSHLPDVTQDFDQSGQEFDQTGQEFNQAGQLMLKQDQLNVEETDSQNTNHGTSIEETLNNFENSNCQSQLDLPDDLDAFLIRKTCVKKTAEVVQKCDKDSDIDNSVKHSDDGNDTDELLRMLGDKGDNGQKQRKQELDGDSTDCEDDGDEYIFKGKPSKVTQVAAVASKVLHKVPARAEPEDDDITDASSDERDTIKSMFANRILTRNQNINVTPKQKPLTRSFVKKTYNVVQKPLQQPILRTQKPIHTYQKKQQSLSKTTAANELNSLEKNNQITIKKTEKLNVVVNRPKVDDIVKRNESNNKEKIDIGKKRQENGEEKSDSEFLDENVFVKNENTEKPKQSQKIMRPEQMDEDLLSDCESNSECDSFYDELPSSDSDCPDDWFKLDIRAERAGDYLPLLGDKAYSLLSTEKAAVSGVISSLCQSMAALSEQASQQATELQRASNNLAVIQSTLRHL